MTILARHANIAIIVLRGGVLALLFGLCFALGYVLSLLARIVLYCAAAVLAGARAGW